ncbi:MAG: peptide chain release factor N(5)-glutamine methyltransferase [Candidatus Avoscillospira sp.]
MVKTYGELYRQIKYALEPEEGPQAANTARELLAFVTGKSPAALMAMQTLYASEPVARQYLELAGRVLAGEPLAYILGQWDFYGLHLTVTPDVLIPRDDTMAVVDLALEQRFQMPKNPRILDLCTGSGCIGLALASQLKDARVTLADLSPKALKVAKKNAADLRLTGRVSCFQADAFVPADKFLGQFDLIISNPPYVTTEDMKTLQRSVRDYEPHMALDGGEDGLDFYRAIAENYTSALKPGGFLALEFGMGQEDDVCRILERFDYEILRLKEDTGHITRAVLAKKKEDGSQSF